MKNITSKMLHMNYQYEFRICHYEIIDQNLTFVSRRFRKFMNFKNLEIFIIIIIYYNINSKYSL